jgi:hypothetical protein
MSYRAFKEIERPKVNVIHVDGRPAIFWTRGDVTSGVAGVEHWNIAGPSVISSRRLVIDSLLDLPKTPTTRPAAAK